MTNGHEVALGLAVFTGVSLGALGGGGSIITLPVLVYVAGVAARPAIGMATTIVGSTSLLGSILHWRRGNFDSRAAIHFGAAGIVGSFAGSTFTHLAPPQLLLALFAAVMFVVGSLMLAGNRTLRKHGAPCSLARFLLTGVAVGLLTGFLGVGGGFLIVPALIWFTKLETRHAIGTSLAIIAANSASGLLGQLRYTNWDWILTLEFIAASLLGMGVGVALAARTPDRTLRRVFGLVVIGIACAMCIRIVS